VERPDKGRQVLRENGLVRTFSDLMRLCGTRNLAYPQLLDEQQTVGIGPVLGDLAVDDAQGIDARECDLAADRSRNVATNGEASMSSHHGNAAMRGLRSVRRVTTRWIASAICVPPASQ
jgi:hypothetical protein